MDRYGYGQIIQNIIKGLKSIILPIIYNHHSPADMLQKIVQNSQNWQQQQKYLQNIVLNLGQDSHQYITQLNLDLVNQYKDKDVLYLENAALWIQIAVRLLSIQESFVYADVNAAIDTPALLLLQAICSKKPPQIVQHIRYLMPKLPGLQQSLVLLSLLCRHSGHSSSSQTPKLMSTLLRLSSYIIQKYLQLKNQPATSSQDRIEDDKVILQCCQKWVVNCLSTFFRTNRSKQGQEAPVLYAMCDMIGAILQIQRDSNLQKQSTQSLLCNTLVPYILQNHCAWSLHETFTKSLHHECFSNPMKKIEIPEQYSLAYVNKNVLNSQAYCYIIVKLLKTTTYSALATPMEIIRLLVPAVGEILARPYEVKIEAIGILTRVLEMVGKVEARNGMEFGYPIQLLLFYLWQYQKQKYQGIRKWLVLSPECNTQSLLCLSNLAPSNLKKQSQKYILQSLSKHNLYEQNRVVLLLTKMQWSQTSAKRQNLLLEAAQKAAPKFGPQIRKLAQSWQEGCSDQSIKERLAKLLAK